MRGDQALSVVIVGGGHGGDAAAGALRQGGFAGPITLVSDDTLPPYHRPPLSKAWLKGEADGASLALRSPNFHAGTGITLLLGRHVAAIDPAGRLVRLADGETLRWDRLILATGARARPLMVAGAETDGVLSLRDAADADRLKAALVPGARLVIVGGGYIGLEVAASARALGVAVTVVEREARVLARVASAELSRFYQARHEREGVSFLLGADVDGIEERAGRVTGVVLRDGQVLPCDVVLVGIGAIPNDHLAREAGLTCEAGVLVDEDGRTSDPDIFAVGDVTTRPLPHYGRLGRVESVPNANEQARRAAAAILGKPAPKHEVPWFWSDQYDLKLQIAGLSFAPDEIVVRGEPEGGRFAVFHLRDERVMAVEAVNAVGEFVAGRKLIGEATRVRRGALRDAAVPMKSVAA